MNCQGCGDDPCSCSPSQLKKKDVREWVVRECEGENCTVMIRELPGQVGSRFCKWCQANGLKTTKVRYLTQENRCLSQEEFGMDLFECIKLFAGRQKLREDDKHMLTDTTKTVAQRQKAHKSFLAREKELTDQITALMPKLAPDDQRRLLDRYESRGAA